MPYSAEHKKETRAKIVESARILFNRHGFEGVSIDMVMERAKLTRGGFYNHFKSKDELFAEAVYSFLMGRGATWREDAGVDLSKSGPVMAQRMLNSYLSTEHLADLDGQCPMIALPSDVSRGGEEVRTSYEVLLKAMVGLFESSLKNSGGKARQNALTLAALCVGGMVLARTLPCSPLADDVRKAALRHAKSLTRAI